MLLLGLIKWCFIIVSARELGPESEKIIVVGARPRKYYLLELKPKFEKNYLLESRSEVNFRILLRSEPEAISSCGFHFDCDLSTFFLSFFLSPTSLHPFSFLKSNWSWIRNFISDEAEPSVRSLSIIKIICRGRNPMKIICRNRSWS